MRKYATFDIVKFISSLFIVGIHLLTLPFNAMNIYTNKPIQFQVFQVFARYAVPFFFITSSFLFFRKYFLKEGIFERKKYRNKAIIRILKLYLFWFIILFPVTFINKFYHGQHGTYLKDFIFLVKDLFLGETFGASWYLSSTIFSILLVTYLINKNISIIKILLMTFPLQIICVLTSVYGNSLRYASTLETVYSVLEYPSLSIIAGVFYFSLGCCIAKYEEKIYSECNLSNIIIVTSLGFTLMFIENNFAAYNNWIHTTDQSFSLAVVAVGLVMICIKLGSYGNDKIMLFLRSASIITYMSHLGFYTLIIYLNKYILQVAILKNKFFIYSIVILLTWITAYIKIKSSKISTLLKYAA